VALSREVTPDRLVSSVTAEPVAWAEEVSVAAAAGAVAGAAGDYPEKD
jgi:hypothetical protein